MNADADDGLQDTVSVSGPVARDRVGSDASKPEGTISTSPPPTQTLSAAEDTLAEDGASYRPAVVMPRNTPLPLVPQEHHVSLDSTSLELKSLAVAIDSLNTSDAAAKIPALKAALRPRDELIPTRGPLSSDQLLSVSEILSIALASPSKTLTDIVLDSVVKLFDHGFWSQQTELLREQNPEQFLAMKGTRFRGPASSNDMSSKEAINAAIDYDPDVEYLSLATLHEIAEYGEANESRLMAQVMRSLVKVNFSFALADEKIQVYLIKISVAAITSRGFESDFHGITLIGVIKLLFTLALQSKSPTVQLLAQAGLLQSVDAIFSNATFAYRGRASTPLSATVTTSRRSSSHTVQDGSESMSSPLESASEHQTAKDSGNSVHSTVNETPTRLGKTPAHMLHSSALLEATRKNCAIADCFFVLRYILKISVKPIPSESVTDIKSVALREKLLSLHLVYNSLRRHSVICNSFIFVPSLPDGVSYIAATKQLLCSAFSRNIGNVVPYVYNYALDIFGLLWLDLRSYLKAELLVIFTEVIIPFMEARSSITFYQRLALFSKLHSKLSKDQQKTGQALVEMYLNYDCDESAINIWERFIHVICKVITSVPPSSGSTSTASYYAFLTKSPKQFSQTSLTSFSKEQVKEFYSQNGDYKELKKSCLNLLVNGVLSPMYTWYERRKGYHRDPKLSSPVIDNVDDLQPFKEGIDGVLQDALRENGVDGSDDPSAFKDIIQRKQVIQNAVRLFNFKPKRGIKLLLDSNCIPADSPEAIAHFLYTSEGINKTILGDFLGEGDEQNIKIMHAFVDLMDFTGLSFVEALRAFLQSFRLPGEAQKIDRFMLKFAERYLKQNPGTFSSADTAYVLSYSAVLLNTDQHNAQVKKRMTKADFIKNNRGIDNGEDIPTPYLEAIFDEISSKEIIMNSEQPQDGDAASPDRPFLLQTLQNGAALVSNISQRSEIGVFASAHQKLARQTEEKLSTINFKPNEQEAIKYYFATHPEHVKIMFQIGWMAILTAVSAPLQDSDDISMIKTSLLGLKFAYSIASIFDASLEMKAFFSTLCKYTIINTVHELQPKNLEATKTLFDLAYSIGDNLKEDWKDVVVCASALDRLQNQTRQPNTAAGSDSLNSQKGRGSNDTKRENLFDSINKSNSYLAEAAAEASSQSMTLIVDRVFTSSAKLSGSAIVDFVKALCDVSLEEINTSYDSEHPRMYCLQRLVEISYYNMNRIRIEWSNIWTILGEHFNKVGCHPNTNVGVFALDKLNQLSMKFLEMDELPTFKFQKDFLRPFEYVLINSRDENLYDLVLVCLKQIILTKRRNLRSGWKTVFSALGRVAQNEHEHVVLLAFNIVKSVSKSGISDIIANDVFADYISCLVNFCRSSKFPRVSLQSIELIKLSIPKVEDLFLDKIIATENNKVTSPDDPNFQLWFPLLFGLYEVIMTCDLEVRTRALESLFKIMGDHGEDFPRDFWEVISKGVLFPIFDDLRLSRQEHTKFANKDDFSEWLSTTLIQAFRSLVDLFSQHFEKLDFILPNMLSLITICMMQENETLASVGGDCLIQLLTKNITVFDDESWSKICHVYVHIFRATTPTLLFFDSSGSRTRKQAAKHIDQAGVTADGSEKLHEANMDEQSEVASPIAEDAAVEAKEIPETQEIVLPLRKSSLPYITRPIDASLEENFDIYEIIASLRPPPGKHEFQQIIVKCVLHLLAIQTLRDTLAIKSADMKSIVSYIPSENVMRLAKCLEESYVFARAFNQNMAHRMALYKMGFMRQLPNLLMQETNSAMGYLDCLFLIYTDSSDAESRDEAFDRLQPLLKNILSQYTSLDPETRSRNVSVWRPVVVRILELMANLNKTEFRAVLPVIFENIIQLLQKNYHDDIGEALSKLLTKLGDVYQVTTTRDVAP